MQRARGASLLAVASLLAACAVSGEEPPQEPSPTPTTSLAFPTSPSPSPSPSSAATPSANPSETPAVTALGAEPGTETAPDDLPAFTSTVSEVVGHPAEGRMRGVSWREGCPVPLEQLRYLTLTHLGLDGAAHTGELVVRADVVDDVLAAFERLYDLRFPIERMQLVDAFRADDDASMRADNTSAFNCRHVKGTQRWSNHASGTAIDINPLRNPYVQGDQVDPPEGAAYADRTDPRPGMLLAGSPEVAAFTDLGWDWGGSWSSGQDYQHVSATGG